MSCLNMKLLLKSGLQMLTRLPANSNLSFLWNFGSFLGIVLMMQLMTGILMSIIFSPSVYSFFLLTGGEGETFLMEILRWTHLNLASLFFIVIFIHISRGLFFLSYFNISLWMSGCSLFVLLMAAAFLGYVLPWGQMSLWGATVITNLFSVVSPLLVLWMWGNFSVSQPTLFLFFSLHFLVPFILLFLVVFHVLLLHESGSSSKILVSFKKLNFSSLFLFKDAMNLLPVGGFICFIFMFPLLLGDPENAIEANPSSSPLHIMPEWYFLWAYAILRSVPSKTGGVLLLLLAVVVLYFLPFKFPLHNKTMNFIFILMIMSMVFLTWLGGCPVEAPYIMTSQVSSLLYFIFILL